MPKLNLIIADSDSAHMNRLVKYLIEKNKQFNISSFSEMQSFIHYLRENNEHIHILLFSEDMISEEFEKKHIDLKMMLSDNSLQGKNKYKTINKYQRTDDFVNDLLIAYSEATETSDALKLEEKDSAHATAFFSPVGGSGKTTLAILTAKALSARGRKSLYLNFEGISSVKSVFGGNGNHTMSEVYLAAKTKKANVGIKIVRCRETYYDTNIDFISPAECSADYASMTPAELKRIVREAKILGQYDDIIIDMNSGYNDDIFEVLDVCDTIMIPYMNNKTSINKLMVFADDAEKLEKIDNIINKAVLVENCSNNVNYESFGGLRVKDCIPKTAVLADIDNILYGDTDGVEFRIISALS